MSPEFQSALSVFYSQGKFLSLLGWVFLGSIVLLTSCKFVRKYWIVALWGCLLFLIGDYILRTSWATLTVQVKNSADKDWLNAHDGGMIIPGLYLVIKSGLCVLLGSVVVFFKNKKSLRKS